jgi:hypothetical protein
MQTQGNGMRSDATRTAIDRHAVRVVGQLLTSVIWLEHRVRSFSTKLSIFPSPRAFGVRIASSSDAHQSDSGRIGACS